MALGPKEMGAAIIANLKSKSGKDLGEWKKELQVTGLKEKKEIIKWLKESGLGHIQAQTVANEFLGIQMYNKSRDMEALFGKFPDQKKQMEGLSRKLEKDFQLKAKPCKGYIPLYNQKGTIALSFKPTPKGLYIGLIGEDFSFPVVAHKKTLGGSERMKYGFYLLNPQEDEQKIYSALSSHS